MIKPAKSEWVRKAFYHLESKVLFPWNFKKIEIAPIELLPDHSVLLLQNHISWWDGFWGNYLSYHFFNKKYHVMVQEDQLKKRPLLVHKGAFSVKKKSREMLDSLDFAANLLQQSNNLVLIFPQGRLQSMHARDIKIEKGVMKLIEKLDGKCQIVYNAVTIDYLESFKPRVKFNLLNCGSAAQIDIENLNTKINDFHTQALNSSVRK